MEARSRHIYVRPTIDIIVLDRQIVCQGTSNIPIDPNEHNTDFNTGEGDINFGDGSFSINGSAFSQSGRIFNNDSPF